MYDCRLVSGPVNTGSKQSESKDLKDIFLQLEHLLHTSKGSMADERIDIYDENNIRIGDEMKSIAHQQALWHRSAHIWIIDEEGNILLQRRSEDKATFPGLRDISVAGHIGLGETCILGAERELEEELGLSAELIEVAYMKRSVDRPRLDYYNREHTYVFICQITQDTPLTFNDGEVAEVKRFTPDQAESIMNGKDETYPSCAHSEEFALIKRYLQENNCYNSVEMSVLLTQ